MILSVLTYPNPLLRRKHIPVIDFDEEFQEFCQSLIETMHTYEGLGLAAMQVGDRRSVFVVNFSKVSDVPEEHRGIWVAANPKIKPLSSDKIPNDEGCLSVPGFSADVFRNTRIQMDYQDEKGAHKTLQTEGLLSVCLQHEFDHLIGKLYIDHLSQRKRNLLLKNYDPSWLPESVQERLQKKAT